MEHVYYEPITKLSTIRFFFVAVYGQFRVACSVTYYVALAVAVARRYQDCRRLGFRNMSSSTEYEEFLGSSLIVIHLYTIVRPLLLEDHPIPALDNFKQSSTSKLNRNLNSSAIHNTEVLGRQQT